MSTPSLTDKIVFPLPGGGQIHGHVVIVDIPSGTVRVECPDFGHRAFIIPLNSIDWTVHDFSRIQELPRQAPQETKP